MPVDIKRAVCRVVAAVVLAAGVACAAPSRTLDLYFIDVEGGQSTLIVTPAGESLLIDAGFPGTGTFESRPGDPSAARDPGRIAAVARFAGIARIDYLLVTHFHGDHVGGVPELAKLIPVRSFIDYGDVRSDVEQNVPGSLDLFAAYAAARSSGRHLQVKAGDRLPLKGIDAVVVSALGATTASPLPGAGETNPSCASSPPPAQEAQENPRSVGVRLRFGRFTFLDLGDLTGTPLFDLACPKDLIGPVDAYLVPHHGGPDATDAATLAAFRPRVAILNNGPTKGGAPSTLVNLRRSPGLEDVWQLHRSQVSGAENFSDDRIANLDERTDDTITLRAKDDGSFLILNARTGIEVRYGVR